MTAVLNASDTKIWHGHNQSPNYAQLSFPDQEYPHSRCLILYSDAKHRWVLKMELNDTPLTPGILKWLIDFWYNCATFL
jgi:hypothetical protein